MTGEPSLPEKVVAIDAALDDARIAHAFGGALALAYYAEPRATIDIDLNLFVGPERHSSVTGALIPLGVSGEIDAASLERDGQWRLWWGRNPIDLFFAYDEIHDAMKRDARRVPFGDEQIRVLAPEHLVACKAVFDRPKDWLDIEQVLVGVERLDVGEIRHWLERLVGGSDARARRFDSLAEQTRGA